MVFKDSYFEDEVRDGFYVNGMMKRCWAAQLEVLSQIDRVCEQYDIHWFADCGTLIGAVRHGGFIPWDDDLDICMLRDDYMKFIKLEDAFPEGYSIATIDSRPGYYQFIGRVINGDKINIDEKHLKEFSQFPYPAGIDVFPIDYVAPTDEEENRRNRAISMLGDTIVALDNGKINEEYALAVMKGIKNNFPVDSDDREPVKKQLYQLTEGLFMMYTPGINGVSKPSEDVVLMSYWNKDRSHRYKRSYFEHYVRLPFENTTVRVPAAYDSVLKIEYGNYLRCSTSGGVHDYPYYDYMEKLLINENKDYPFRYEFGATDIKGSRERGEKPVYMLKKFASVAAGMQDAMAELLSSDRYDETCEILDTLKNLAERNATVFTDAYGRDSGAAGLCLEYAQQSSAMKSGINEDNEDKVQEAYSMMDSVISQMDTIASELENVREVVFITYKPEKWKFYDKIWRNYSEADNTKVTVINIPYYYRDIHGNFIKCRYDSEGYPAYVKLTKPENYNIKARHPDIIFTQDPFDSINYTLSIHPEFYSEHLRYMTDRLVYVQSFETDDIGEDNEKGVFSAKYFIKTPGVVNADEVVVPSDAMRKLYISVLTDYAGKETEKIWENKIKCNSSWRPSPDGVELCIPGEWEKIIKRPDGSRKKIILYRVSASPVFEFGYEAIEKIKRSLDVFYKRRDEIAVIFSPEECIWNSGGEPEGFCKELKNIAEEFEKAGWGIYAADDKTDVAAWICDGYYGDAGSLVNRCRRMGKPVMIEDVYV